MRTERAGVETAIAQEGVTRTPFAYTDPRALSDAWYDALYAKRQTPQASAATMARQSPREEPAANAAPGAGAKASSQTNRDVPVREMRPSGVTTPRGGQCDDRRADSTLARRDVAQSASAVRTAHRQFADLTASDGSRMRMFVAQRGDALHISIVGTTAQTRELARELEHVRAVLAARGIRARIDLHSEDLS